MTTTPSAVVQIGNYRHPWCTEVHLGKALRANGCEVTQLQEDLLDWAILPALVDEAGAQMVLWTRTWPIDNAKALAAFEVLRSRHVPVVSYHLDRWWGLGREEELRTLPFFKTDLVISPDGTDRPWAELGINHLWLPPGVDREECGIGRRRSQPFDIVFVGSHPYPHKEWEPVRTALIEAVRARYPKRFMVLPQPGRPVRGKQLSDLMMSTKVVVGDSCLAGNPRLYWSDRVTETLGRGGFLLHPRADGIEDWYQDCHDLALYDVGDHDRVLELIENALDDDDWREHIARQGQKTVLGRDTYDHRMRQLLDHVAANFEVRDRPEVRPAPKTSTRRVTWKPNRSVGATLHHLDTMGVRHALDEVWTQNSYQLDAGWVRGGTVLDIGANMGAFSVLANRLGAARVVAFEPHPDNFAVLAMNAASIPRNARLGSVEVRRQAVLDRPGTLVLAGEGGGAHLVKGRAEGHEVEVVAIADVLAEVGEVRLMKLDCEGAEYDIVGGIPDEAFARIRHIVMEFHGPAMPHLAHLSTKRFPAMVAKLAEHGNLRTQGSPSRGGMIWWSRA